LAIYEAGVERRFGIPVVPVSDYGQALCRKCGLLYLNSSISDDYLVKLYSQETLDWQREYTEENTVVWNGGTSEEESRRFANVVEVVASFKNVKGVKWLDFGCQTGELGEICQTRYATTMYGVEVSEDYAAIADKKWGGGNRVKTSIKPFLEGGQTFDVISSLETLEHIATPWNTVNDLKMAMATDGLLIVTVPSSHYFHLKYFVFKVFRTLFSRKSLQDRTTSVGRSVFGLCHTHPYNFSPVSLKLMLERGGFTTIYVGGSGWSERFRVAAWMARVIAALTGNRVQIFPSVLAVAKVTKHFNIP